MALQDTRQGFGLLDPKISRLFSMAEMVDCGIFALRANSLCVSPWSSRTIRTDSPIDKATRALAGRCLCVSSRPAVYELPWRKRQRLGSSHPCVSSTVEVDSSRMLVRETGE